MRSLLTVVLWSICAVCAGQSFPSKPIRLIAPFAPGGALDLIARGVGAKLSESFG